MPGPRPVARIVRRAALVISLLAVPGLVLSFCVGSPRYYREKYSAVGPARPTSRADFAHPDKQVEPHTCGFHAMSSVYRAYGLDPDALRLRFRLGVDKPFTNLLPELRGTIHPDLLRVLDQDGFRVTSIDPQGVDAAERLAAHLDSGQVAIALIRVTGLHWIVIAGQREGHLVICDSLKDSTYEEAAGPYLADRVYSLLLIKPRD